MAVALTQVITEDRASGAQVIDGSLKFNETYLSRTPSSAGNRRTFTFSVWLKRSGISAIGGFFSAFSSNSSRDAFRFDSSDEFRIFFNETSNGNIFSNAKYRDVSAWYHFVVAVDTTQATAADRVKVWTNGESITFRSASYPSQNTDLNFNNTVAHYIGHSYTPTDQDWQGYLTEFHHVDGQALDASYFGFTDPLTNTWRPKKYTGTYGTNGFWLPMDGNSPIGEDKSGNGNDFTPSNFDNSAALDKATGALPILNTVSGGNYATVGVRTDAYANNLVLALPLVGSSADVSNQINSGSTTKVVTENGTITNTYTTGNFYGASTTLGGSIGDNLTIPDSEDFNLGSGDWTFEAWIRTTTTASRTSSVVFNQSTVNAASDSAIFFGAGSTGISLYLSTTGTSWTDNINTDSTINDGEWHHIVWQRRGNTLEIYKDGILQPVISGNSSFTGTINNSSRLLYIGQQDTPGNNYSGQLQDLRIYKGVAKYTSNFIPASTDPDILPDTPSGVAGGSALTKIADGAVSFDNSSDSLTTPDHADFDLGTNSFTIEAFIYLKTTGQFNNIFAVGTDASNGYRIDVTTGNDLRFLSHIGGTWTDQGLVTDDPLAANRWYHVAVTRNGNDFDIWIDGKRGCSTVTSSSSITNPDTQLEIGRLSTNGLDRNYHGYISNLRFVNGSAVYTSPFTPPTEPLTEVTNTKLLCCQSNTSANVVAASPGTFVNDGTNYSSGNQVTGSAGLTNKDSIFNGWLRESGASVGGQGANVDLSSDNYILWTPTTGISYSSKVEVYCYAPNGYEITTYYTFNGGTETSFTGGSSGFNGNAWITVATGSGTINSIKIRITRGSGNQTNVQWYAVRVDGTILINDYNGRAIARVGDAAATTFNPFTTDINAVRGQESGYATFNRLAIYDATALSNGNLTCTGGNDVPSTIGASSGKWYAEAFIDNIASTLIHFGICATGTRTFGEGADTNHIIGHLDEMMIRSDAAGPYNASGRGAITSWTQVSDTNATFTTGDVISVELDLDNDYVKWYKNGILRTYFTFVRASGFDKMYFFNRNNGSGVSTWNFGQKPFKFTPPDGFKTLCLANLPRPSGDAAVRPDKYFGTLLYTADVASGKTVTGLNFGAAPDFVWIKNRDNVEAHHLIDVVRGNDSFIMSNLTDSERDRPVSDTNDTTDFDFVTNGFSFVSTNYNAGELYFNNRNYVAWCWKAGGAAVSNTDGDITSSISVNQDAGFSIVSYNGSSNVSDTVGHGLEETPSFILVKARTQPYYWRVYHSVYGTSPTQGLLLGSGATSQNGSYNHDAHGGVGSVSTSTFGFGTNGTDTLTGVNKSGDSYIAYCWSEVPGFSKFGTYTGNDNVNGIYIHCGFRPAMLIIKRIDTSGTDWVILDSVRETYNPVSTPLFANSTNDEPTSSSTTLNDRRFPVDFLSDGFKMRVQYQEVNGASGGVPHTYIYCAWAEAPTVNLYGAQANAR